MVQWLCLITFTTAAQVRCLNEAVAGSCRGVFKEWSKRLEPTSPPLASNDDDPELLLHVP